MGSERKSIWEKIKSFFKNIFKKDKMDALPKPEHEMELKQEQNKEIEIQHETEPQASTKSREECIELYKKIKEMKGDYQYGRFKEVASYYMNMAEKVKNKNREARW